MEEEEEWEVGRIGRGEGKRYEGWAEVEGGYMTLYLCISG